MRGKNTECSTKRCPLSSTFSKPARSSSSKSFRNVPIPDRLRKFHIISMRVLCTERPVRNDPRSHEPVSSAWNAVWNSPTSTPSDPWSKRTRDGRPKVSTALR